MSLLSTSLLRLLESGPHAWAPELCLKGRPGPAPREAESGAHGLSRKTPGGPVARAVVLRSDLSGQGGRAGGFLGRQGACVGPALFTQVHAGLRVAHAHVKAAPWGQAVRV